MGEVIHCESFWTTVNRAISDEEREAYNNWRERLDARVDKLKTCLAATAFDGAAVWDKVALEDDIERVSGVISEAPLLMEST